MGHASRSKRRSSCSGRPTPLRRQLLKAAAPLLIHPRWQGRVLHLKALDPSSCKLTWGPTPHLPSDSLSLGLGSSSSVSLTGFSLYEVHSKRQHLPQLDALFSVTKTPQALVWLSPVEASHLNSRICSAYAALCLRSVCFMRVSARVLVGLSLGFSAVVFDKKTVHWCIW